MNNYYWEAIRIENGEHVGGACFASSKEAAIDELERYGFYCEIVVSECR